jgi:hypothetical protein
MPPSLRSFPRRVMASQHPKGDAQGGFQQSGLKSLLWGEPRCLRRGGNPPAPAFPRRGKRAKGECFALPLCVHPYAMTTGTWVATRVFMRAESGVPLGVLETLVTAAARVNVGRPSLTAVARG